MVSLTGAPWDVLPPGIHLATFGDVETVFATNEPRRRLYGGLLLAAGSLLRAGCPRIYLDGSYVTAKPIPKDYDACWDAQGVDPTKLDPVFLDFANKRQAQKDRFGGEFFPTTMGSPGNTFLEFFQVERYSGGSKGILSIDLTNDATLTGRTAQ